MRTIARYETDGMVTTRPAHGPSGGTLSLTWAPRPTRDVSGGGHQDRHPQPTTGQAAAASSGARW